MSGPDGLARLEILCRGVVQGVGFRPRVWQLAHALGLTGTLRNVAGAVLLDLQGERPQLEQFLTRLPGELPAAARLEALESRWCAPLQPAPRGLTIAAGPPRPLGAGLIAPALVADRAPCPACRAELLDPANRRHGYPFISCSVCGPRYSIATAEPFSRAHTTLAAFPLCRACQAEFGDPANRRFHAETIGCPACGPRLRLLDPAGGTLAAPQAEPLAAALALLRGGGILALQGVGGFQLLVNAADGTAVARLRQRKRRPHKPFALLVDTVQRLASLLRPSAAELAALADPAAPIVLLPCSEAAHRRALPGVAPGSPALGVMLPASPLHLLLALGFAAPLVATSGNGSGEPLCTGPAEALERLAGLADGFLVHDRAIARPLDDSVLQLIDGRPALLRRARGFAPEPLALPPQPLPQPGPQPTPQAAAGEGPSALLALGGDLKSAPALALGDRLWLAPHLGDLADGRALAHWRRGVAELLAHPGLAPAAVALDRHPGYLSHQALPRLLAAAAPDLPRWEVAHHLAHGLAVALEHGLSPEGLPLLALDGLGFGAGAVPLWGCELLRLEPGGAGPGGGRGGGREGGLELRRLASLRPFPLPGAERAVREPRRSALGLLHGAGLLDHPGAAAVRGAFEPRELGLLRQALASGCNAPHCSSAGRLFDAVAALLGLVAVASHEAQAGLALQAAAAAADPGAGAYPLPLRPAPGPGGGAEPLALLDWQPLLECLLADRAAGRPVELCAARFHNGLVAGLVEAVLDAVASAAGSAVSSPSSSTAPAVALAGGCFQNRLLLEGLVDALRRRGIGPCWPERLPAGDGGLAAGQIAALRLGTAVVPHGRP